MSIKSESFKEPELSMRDYTYSPFKSNEDNLYKQYKNKMWNNVSITNKAKDPTHQIKKVENDGNIMEMLTTMKYFIIYF